MGDTSGRHGILPASIRAERSGGRLVLVRGRAQLDRVLDLTTGPSDLEIVDLNPWSRPIMALL